MSNRALTGVFENLAGCQINNAISRACRMENLSTRPCEVQGKRCGPSANGVCATGSVCCETGNCVLEIRIRKNFEETNPSPFCSIDRCYEDQSCLREQKFKDSPLFAKSPFKIPFGDKARVYHLTPENLEIENQESELMNKYLLGLLEKSEAERSEKL